MGLTRIGVPFQTSQIVHTHFIPESGRPVKLTRSGSKSRSENNGRKNDRRAGKDKR